MSSLSVVRKLRKSRSFWLGVVMSLGISGGAVTFVILQWEKLEYSFRQNVEDVITYARPETLTIKAADSTILAQFGDTTYENLPITQIPEQVQQAFIAVEDSRYYQHWGVDYQGVIRAAIANLKAGKVVEGGSTITQQLARIVYLEPQRSWQRKMQEMVLAQRIEAKLTKAQILERYLNLVYLGSGAYGVADAAWVYFSKPIEQLTVAQVATIAGIAPAPSVYSPLKNPQAAKARRDLVLQRMHEQEFITEVEMAAAIASPLETQESIPKRLERKAPYFVEYIQQELPQYISPEQLKAGGIVVETPLNLEWQATAEANLKQSISKYGKWGKFQQGALVAIDPRSGEIKVMVGGKKFDDNQYNRVTQAQRQPGSTFKTFIYTTAIAGGMTPEKKYLDAPYAVDGYRPKNYGNRYRGYYVPIHKALASSINVVALKSLIDIGWTPTITIAKKMGIESELQSTYSLALGASEVNLLELTNAYGTLANQGNYQKAYGISRILDAKGNTIYQANFPAQTALDKDTAAIMTWMLQKVVKQGTGIPAQIGRPVAGKTGTSDQSRDLWFIGYIPQLVTGVWFGNDDNQPTRGTSGIAAQLWRSFMLEAVKGMPIETFPPPPKSLSLEKATIKLEPIKRKKTPNSGIVRAYTRTRRRSNYRARRRRRSYTTTRRRTTNRRRTTVVKNSAPAINKAPKPSPANNKAAPSLPQLNKPTKLKN